jgi:hypothetical protein
MSKHPEVLWAQRSSETAEEKVSTPPTSDFKHTHSPLNLLRRHLLCVPNLECSIRDNQPSRYCRIVSSVRAQAYRTLFQGSGRVCHCTLYSNPSHSLLGFITPRAGESSTYEFNIDLYKEIIPEVLFAIAPLPV